MRALGPAVLALSLALCGPAMVQAQPAPLPPGKPAGLKPAQRGDNTLAIVLGVGAVAAGVALVASNSDDTRNPVVPTTTTAP